MAKHLHQQAGGNPAQGPEGEMANPTPEPGSPKDFPDGPDAEPLHAAKSDDDETKPSSSN